MKVVRLSDARPYTAPKHFDLRSLRLLGFEVSETTHFWVRLSHYLPGGVAERDGVPLERVYVVVGGQITVIIDSGEATLSALDPCCLATGEARAVENRTNRPASMIVIMPYPPER